MALGVNPGKSVITPYPESIPGMIPQRKGTSNQDLRHLSILNQGNGFGDIEESFMFHEVKIIDKKGNVKKVLSSKTLSKRYWNNVRNANPKGIKIKGKKRKSNKPDDFLDSSDFN